MKPGTRYTLKLERTRINDEGCDGASYETVVASYFLSDREKESTFFKPRAEEITEYILDMLCLMLRSELNSDRRKE